MAVGSGRAEASSFLTRPRKVPQGTQSPSEVE
jgi:hypothetical protein